MMVERRDIELIPEEVAEEKKKIALRRLVNLGGFGLLIVAALVAAGLSLAVGAQTTALQDTQKKIAVKKADLESMAEVEKMLIGLGVKSNALTSILNQRKYSSLILEALAKSLSGGVSINSLVVGTENSLGVTGEVLSYADLANFLRDTVDPSKGGTLFEEISLSSVSFNATEGTIQFTAEIYFPTGALGGAWESLLGEGWEDNLDESWEALRKEKGLL